jgi:putative salt-induced outer membrane protein YdiY
VSRSSLAMICTLAAVALGARAAAASTILNTLQGYSDDGPGWSGGLDGLYAGSGGNTERILFSAGGRVQWQGERDRLRLQVSGGYEESARQVTARNAVVHLRHNRALRGRWATIVFTQLQADRFQRLKSRWLAGAGLRRDLAADERGTVSVGATPMLEVERLEGETGKTARGRLSVFLHVAWPLSDTATLDGAAFWQPLFSDLGDARAVGNVSLGVDVTGSLDLKVGAAIEDDARPPAGVARTDWKTFAGLGLDF